MKEKPDARELIHATVPIAVVLLVLATSTFWEPQRTGPGPETLSPLAALTLIAAVAGLYGLVGGRTLKLGAMVLLPGIWFVDVAWVGWSAGAVYLLREVGQRLLLGVPSRQAKGLRGLHTVTDAARVSLAAILAGYVWVLGADGELVGASTQRLLQWTALTMTTYGVTLLLLHWVEWRDLEKETGSSPLQVGRSLVWDLTGWLVGLLLLSLIVAAAAAGSVHLRQRAVTRATELWEVTKAGHRIIFRGPDLASMAGHVLQECQNVLPFHWFQFELLKGEEQGQSWCAGPDGELREGQPDPADGPPVLPGVHRRASWKILQRQLKGDGEPIAVLRFWCDPRKLEAASIELLDSLLPQIAAAVHRALLDRQAKQDPLTGLADRRVLEARLEEVFVQTYAMGGSMAVIMCDLDRFKKINDTHGHDVGDKAILQVVQILEEHRRDTDLCSRYGGEEFALVLEKTDGQTALLVAERLRHAVEHSLFVPDGKPVPLRLSAGVAAYPEIQVKEGKDLLVLADEALIQAKKKGRNRSLLNLGRNRYKTPRNRILGKDEKSSTEPEAPTLFA